MEARPCEWRRNTGLTLTSTSTSMSRKVYLRTERSHSSTVSQSTSLANRRPMLREDCGSTWISKSIAERTTSSATPRRRWSTCPVLCGRVLCTWVAIRLWTSSTTLVPIGLWSRARTALIVRETHTILKTPRVRPQGSPQLNRRETMVLPRWLDMNGRTRSASRWACAWTLSSFS